MPAVIGVPRLTKIIDNDELVIVDGYEGVLLVNPTQAMISEYQSRVSRHEEAETKLLENRLPGKPPGRADAVPHERVQALASAVSVVPADPRHLGYVGNS